MAWTLWAAIFLPLAGAITNGLILQKSSKQTSHMLGTAVMFAAALLATIHYVGFLASGEDRLLYLGFEWIRAGDFEAPFKLNFDRLSGMMTMIVLWIGSLIHMFAGGYMHDEAKTYRFFSYLNLFVFMMLLLVLGDNLLVMFVGWEGVGLCSYLLIGYWYTESENASAGMKAFLVNRIGDMGFIIGIFLIFTVFGTISFSELRGIIFSESYDPAQLGLVGLATLALFVGACGKSAQIPLYVWLPDAMAGPTPVSALIHAATMVTAGIFMMFRLNYLFFLAPDTMAVIAVVGGLTAFFAATIAVVQNDIKKVLAYSTVSQLGYMVMACGVGAFGVGFFHVFTHACFKALMFMGAGSIIVAMHHKQDMRIMGGLKQYMPITHAVFMCGWLAIIGFPLTSGFFSKDEILWYAFLGGGWPLWALGAITAGLTAFYMSRLYYFTFHGPNRSDEHTRSHLHETSWVMWGALIPLAFGSLFAGFLAVPEFMTNHAIPNLMHHYFEPLMQIPERAKQDWAFMSEHHNVALEWGLMGVSVALAFSGLFLARALYKNGPAPVLDQWRQKFAPLYETLQNKYWIDEFYFAYVVAPVRDMANFLFKIFDVMIVDGIVNGFAQATTLIGGLTSFRMSGSLHRHGMLIVVGLMGMLSLLIFS